jgi:uncharacterized protein YjbI with pentapeptide repeats
LFKDKLVGADLSEADLCGTDLRGANLNGAILRAAKYDSYTVFPEDFDPANALMQFVAEETEP